MPELEFQVTGAEAVTHGLSPLVHFHLLISASEGEQIQTVLLQAQVQLQCPQRTYSPQEKRNLVEIFGPPESWGQTLRNRLWTHTQATVGAFEGITRTVLPAPCTFDLNLAVTKYFYGLTEGDVPLLFLFSGSLFYTDSEGRLQVQRISWNKECTYRMPLQVWRQLMEQHYPNSAWLYLRRDVFDRLCAYKRAEGLASWEEVIERLLKAPEGAEPTPPEALTELAL